MMRKIAFYLFFATLLVVLSSCKQQLEVEEDDRQPIEFRSFLKEGDEVRPIVASRAIVGNLSAGFVLGGSWSTTAFTATTAANKTDFVTNRPMKSDGTDASASSAPKLFWKADGTTNHGFYAYSTNPVGTASGFGVYSPKTGVGQAHAVLGFKQLDAPNQQIDLLVAESLDHKVGLGAPSLVNLYFEHRFARVRVRIYGNGTVAINNCQGSITYSATNAPANDFPQHDYVKLAGKYNSLVASATKHSGTYPIGTPFQITQANINAGTAATVGDMILQPQALTEGWAVFGLTYTVEGSAVAKTVSVGLPALTLEPSRQYDVSVFLSEYNSLLAVSGVLVGQWVTESDVIDHYVVPNLTISAAAPTDAPVPVAGGSYNVTITSNAAWTASELTNVTLDRIAGGIGTTTVKVTVPANTAAARAVSVKFTTDAIVGGGASTKTWEGTQEPGAPAAPTDCYDAPLPNSTPGVYVYVAKQDNVNASWADAYANCNAWGGRLPVSDECGSLVRDRANYGSFREDILYWSGRESGGGYYYVYTFSPIGEGDADGTTTLAVRCVKDLT